MSGSLAGKTCLVTGGSRGIGRATVLALAEAGANVAINYQRSADAAAETCELAKKMGVDARIYKADVSREDEANPMIEQVLEDLGTVHDLANDARAPGSGSLRAMTPLGREEEPGTVDVLVNNAGVTRDRSFLKMTKLMWDEVLGVNLNGPFNVTHALLPAMVDAGWGRIINVASIVGQTGNFGQANYAVTKGGIIAFTMTLVARKGITVNAVAPGFIETDMTKDVPASAIENVKAMTPLGRLGKPEEIAAAIEFLASPRAGYITGQVIPVNGGMYM